MVLAVCAVRCSSLSTSSTDRCQPGRNSGPNLLFYQMQERKSIEQLENDYWADFDFPTALVERCHKYRKIPIKNLTIEQIRTLISQNIGLEFLLPKALDVLKLNILAEGEYYPGDLLSAVLTTKEWNDEPLREQFKVLLRQEREYVQGNTVNKHRQLSKQIDKFLDS